MPQIATYDSTVNPEAVVNTKQANGVSIGSGLEQLGAGVQNLGKGINEFQTRKETGDAMKQLSDLQISSIAKIKTLQSSLSSDDLEAMVSDYDDKAAAIQGNLKTSQGSEYFEKQNRYTRDLIYNSLVAKNSELQKNELFQGFGDDFQNQRKIVWNDTSPGTLQTAMDATENHAMLLGPSQGDARAKVVAEQSKNTLALDNFQGLLAKGQVDVAKDRVESGFYDKYLNFDDKGRSNDKDWMLNQIERAQRAKETDDKTAALALKNRQKEVQESTMNVILGGLTTGKDPDGNPVNYTSTDINYGIGRVLTPQQKENLMRIKEAQANQVDKTDPVLYNQLRQRIYAPENQMDKITDPVQLQDYVAKGLSSKDLFKLQKEMQNMRTPLGNVESKMYNSVLDTAKKALTNDEYGVKDPNGAANLYQFEQAYHAAYQEGRTNRLTPEQLTNPASKDYLGKMIPQFRKTFEQRQQEQLQMAAPSSFNFQKGTEGLPPGAPAVGGNSNQQSVTITKSSAIPVQNAPQAPKIGEVRNGYKYTGGDPSLRSSWKK